MSKPPKHLTTPEEQEAWKAKRREYQQEYYKNRYADPERRSRMLEISAACRATPVGREKLRKRSAKYRATPAAKAKKKAYEATEEFKRKRKAWADAEGAKRKKKAYESTLKSRVRQRKSSREYSAKPEAQAKKRERMMRYQATPERKASAIAKSGKRRALKRAATVGDIKEIAAWVKHWKRLPVVFCHWCGGAFKPDKCHADHVMPLSKGGAHCRSNMALACATCNLRKSAKHPDEWIKEMAAATA